MGFRSPKEVILQAGSILTILQGETPLFVEAIGSEDRHYWIDSWPLGESAKGVSIKAMKYDLITKIIQMEDCEALQKSLLDYLNGLVFEDDYYWQSRSSKPSTIEEET